jgi:hypothetical protein
MRRCPTYGALQRLDTDLLMIEKYVS